MNFSKYYLKLDNYIIYNVENENIFNKNIKLFIVQIILIMVFIWFHFKYLNKLIYWIYIYKVLF